MKKSVAAALMAGLVISVLLPVHEDFRGEHGDEFPFSWYPMFSRPRPKLEPVHYVIGLTSDGSRRIIHSRLYVRGGMNQARRQLDRLVRKRKTARATCEKAAESIATRRAFDAVVEVRVVRGFYDMEKYFSKRDKLPEKENVIATCRVKRQDNGGV